MSESITEAEDDAFVILFLGCLHSGKSTSVNAVIRRGLSSKLCKIETFCPVSREADEFVNLYSSVDATECVTKPINGLEWKRNTHARAEFYINCPILSENARIVKIAVPDMKTVISLKGKYIFRADLIVYVLNGVYGPTVQDLENLQAIKDIVGDKLCFLVSGEHALWEDTEENTRSEFLSLSTLKKQYTDVLPSFTNLDGSRSLFFVNAHHYFLEATGGRNEPQSGWKMAGSMAFETFRGFLAESVLERKAERHTRLALRSLHALMVAPEWQDVLGPSGPAVTALCETISHVSSIVDSSGFSIAISGGSKSGKSTVINSLLHRDICVAWPKGAAQVIIKYVHTRDEEFVEMFEEGREGSTIVRLPAISEELGARMNAQNTVPAVIIAVFHLRCFFLEGGITLIQTSTLAEADWQYAKQCDAVIYVMNASIGLTHQDAAVVRFLQQSGHSYLYLVFNKINAVYDAAGEHMAAKVAETASCASRPLLEASRDTSLYVVNAQHYLELKTVSTNRRSKSFRLEGLREFDEFRNDIADFVRHGKLGRLRRGLLGLDLHTELIRSQVLERRHTQEKNSSAIISNFQHARDAVLTRFWHITETLRRLVMSTFMEMARAAKERFVTLFEELVGAAQRDMDDHVDTYSDIMRSTNAALQQASLVLPPLAPGLLATRQTRGSRPSVSGSARAGTNTHTQASGGWMDASFIPKGMHEVLRQPISTTLSRSVLAAINSHICGWCKTDFLPAVRSLHATAIAAATAIADAVEEELQGGQYCMEYAGLQELENLPKHIANTKCEPQEFSAEVSDWMHSSLGSVDLFSEPLRTLTASLASASMSSRAAPFTSTGSSSRAALGTATAGCDEEVAKRGTNHVLASLLTSQLGGLASYLLVRKYICDAACSSSVKELARAVAHHALHTIARLALDNFDPVAGKDPLHFVQSVKQQHLRVIKAVVHLDLLWKYHLEMICHAAQYSRQRTDDLLDVMHDEQDARRHLCAQLESYVTRAGILPRDRGATNQDLRHVLDTPLASPSPVGAAPSTPSPVPPLPSNFMISA